MHWYRLLGWIGAGDGPDWALRIYFYLVEINRSRLGYGNQKCTILKHAFALGTAYNYDGSSRIHFTDHAAMSGLLTSLDEDKRDAELDNEGPGLKPNSVVSSKGT